LKGSKAKDLKGGPGVTTTIGRRGGGNDLEGKEKKAAQERSRGGSGRTRVPKRKTESITQQKKKIWSPPISPTKHEKREKMVLKNRFLGGGRPKKKMDPKKEPLAIDLEQRGVLSWAPQKQFDYRDGQKDV